LPRREDLGAAPSGRSGRPIATYDVTAIGRGAQALGRGIAQAGDAFAALENADDAAKSYETERKFQELMFKQELDLDDLKQNLQPGQGGNFANSWAEGYKKSANEFYQTVPEKLRPEYHAKLFGAERKFYRDAAVFGREEQKRSATNDLLDFQKLYAPKPGNLDAGKSAYLERLNRTPYLSPIEKDEFKRKGFSLLEETYADHLIEKGAIDPHELRRDLGFGPELDANENPELRAKPISGAGGDDISPLLKAVESVESGGRADAVSPKGAQGLMQVMPETGREIAAELGDVTALNMSEKEFEGYLKQKDVSRKYGAHYLQKMLTLYGGDKEAALIAYNGGPERAKAWLEADRDDSVIPKESADYYKKVMAAEEKSGGKLVSFTDYARGKGVARSPGVGAETGYEAASKLGIEPTFNQARTLGIEDAELSSVKAKSGASFTVAAPAARQFQGFIEELEATGYQIKPQTSGGYNDRNIRGTDRKSQHAHGAAIDVNWQDNLFDEKGTNNLPPNVGEIAAKWGLSWGGYFKGDKKDAMHFEVSRLLPEDEIRSAASSVQPTRVASLPGTTTDTYTGPYQNLTQEQRLRLANKLDAQIRQETALTRQAVTSFDKMAEKGFAPNPREVEALRAKVDSSRDPQLIQEFREAETIMQWQDAARKVRPDELDAFIRSETDRVAGKGATPFDVRRIEVADKLLTNMRKELKEDPLGWADRVGLVKVEPIDFSSPEAAEASLAKRIEQADTVTKQYGTSITYLRPDERHKLVTAVEQGGDQTIAVAGMIASTAGSRTPAILGEIFKESPTAGVIGGLVAETGLSPASRDAADGLALSKQPGFQSLAPGAAKARVESTALLGTALAGLPTAENAIISAANHIYNIRARREGIAEFDSSVWQQGLREALGERKVGDKVYGGVVDANPSMWGSRNIILPPYLVQDGWRDAIEAMNMKDFEAAGLGLPAAPNGELISLNRVKGAILVQTGDGRYALSLKNPDMPGEEQWIVRNDAPSERFEIDFRALRPRLETRRPDLFLSPISFDMRNPETRPFGGSAE
jgi:hypothetical protein